MIPPESSPLSNFRGALNKELEPIGKETCAIITYPGCNSKENTPESITGLIKLSNDQIASVNSSGDVVLWHVNPNDSKSAIRLKATDGSPLSALGANSNNFISYGKDRIAYPDGSRTLYIACDPGGALLSDITKKITLDIWNLADGAPFTCKETQQFIAINQLNPLSQSLEVNEKESIFFPFPLPGASALLWDNKETLITGDSKQDSISKVAYLRLWKNRMQSRRLASSHTKIERLLLLGEAEVVSMGPNDSYSPSYFPYGDDFTIRRWRSPHAQEELINKIRAAQTLEQLLAIACSSVDLSTIIKDDQLSSASQAAKITCRNLKV